MQALQGVALGRRLNPQRPPPSSPWFEGWYSRVVAPGGLSFGLLTGSFPPLLRGGGGNGLALLRGGGPAPQPLRHAPAYTALLANHHAPAAGSAAASKLLVAEAYADVAGLEVQRGQTPNLLGATQHTAFAYAHDWGQGRVSISGCGPALLQHATIGDASLTIRNLSGATHWSDDGGSPQYLLHLVPGIGLNWYVHSTCSLVAYEYKGPNPAPGPSHGRRVHLSGVGWAHCEKNWGSSFPRSFIWAQGFATSSSSGGRPTGLSDKTAAAADASDSSFDVEAQFCVAGGALPTWNADRLPVPLPDVLLLGYRSRERNWHFGPQRLALVTSDVDAARGRVTFSARQWPRTLVLTLEAPPASFSRVGGPTRGGFVPASVESYSAVARVECLEHGRIVESRVFDAAALEFGGAYAHDLAAGGGVVELHGLARELQWE